MLAVLTTHPIQYQVPIWRALAQRGKLPLEVFFMSDWGLENRFDPGFGRKVAWDIDLLTGYTYRFLEVRHSSTQESFWWLRLNPGLVDLLQSRGIRTLWVQGWQVSAYWQAVWQANSAGIPVWVRGESNLRSGRGGFAGGIKRLMLKQLFSRIDRFLYIGNANHQFYRSYGIAEDRLSFAPYCVDNARFEAQAAVLRSSRQRLRRQWNIPDEAYCVVFVGKYIDKKRPGDLVAAARSLRGRYPLHLLFVGTGQLGYELRSSCAVAFDAEHLHTSDLSGPPASFAGFSTRRKLAKLMWRPIVWCFRVMAARPGASLSTKQWRAVCHASSATAAAVPTISFGRSRMTSVIRRETLQVWQKRLKP
jgi:glycosyltransferase involved in cell wall biosynthesis